MKKKIKIIDLLNKIANGEEVPKKIKHTWEYEYKIDELRETYCYFNAENERFDADWLIIEMLNDEVEILDEEDEFEDIEEIVHEYIYGLNENEEKIDDRVSRFEEKINQLIKNQKKIIERLNNE